MTREIRLFLASSIDLTDERTAIERFVRRENVKWRPRGLYIRLQLSDDASKAVDQDGSQSVLDEQIRASDVFVVLYWQAVGEFTSGEFEVALSTFEGGHDIRILVFKSTAKLPNEVTSDELRSRETFEARVREIKHYSSTYDNVDHLIGQLSDQLNRDFLPGQGSVARTRHSSLADLTRLTLSIDELLLRTVRNLADLKPRERVDAYETLIKGRLEGMPAGEFFPGYLQDRAHEFAGPALENVDLRIDLDRDLRWLTYTTDDFELTVESPVLMWNCTCGSLADRVPGGETGSEWTSPDECPIHRDPNGARLTELYRSGLISTTYDDHRVIWRRSKEVWPPTIDSFVMCRNLTTRGILGRDYRSVIDIGCGTGFLGLYLGRKIATVRDIWLADWMITPLLYAMMSWQLDPERHAEERMLPLLGMDTTWFTGTKPPSVVDICVCNPPYLPSFDDFPGILDHHTVGGTDLLEHMIERADIARETYINFSHMAWSEAQAAAERSGRTVREIGEPYDVPFTVPQATRYPGYIQRLAAEGRIFERPGTVHRWWHRINTFIVEN